MREAATGIGDSRTLNPNGSVHGPLSWGWGLNGYLGMLDNENFSREDLGNSEEVEAGVWVDWDARLLRIHSAVISVIERETDS